jgi:predicted GNAT family acetyltransferase
MTNKATFEVINNNEESRFETVVEGHMAVLEFQIQDDRIVMTSTRVPKPLEGRGIGSALARTALAYAREAGLAVVAQCSFVQAYIERHPELL